MIADKDLELFSYAETPAAAWDIIARFHDHAGVSSDRGVGPRL